MSEVADTRIDRIDRRIYNICMLIARIGLAYLFFTQLFWKLPPKFGCGSNYAFPKPAEQNYFDSNKSSGLCYWMGLESIYASQPRQVLVADMRSAGWLNASVSITPLAKVNGWLLDNLFIPNIEVVGWLVWLAEFWVFLSMLLGILTRLGAILSIGIIGQLYIGLANVPRPFEWEWTYGAILLLSVAMLGAAAGRYMGVDAWLRKRLSRVTGRGRWLAKTGLYLS
jgi:hypothetical protein